MPTSGPRPLLGRRTGGTENREPNHGGAALGIWRLGGHPSRHGHARRVGRLDHGLGHPLGRPVLHRQVWQGPPRRGILPPPRAGHGRLDAPEHREGARASPHIYASWAASTPSHFTYIPGSFTPRGTVGGLHAVAADAYPKDAWTTAVIPAGSIVVFDPTLTHRVAAVNYTKAPQHRYFCGISTGPPSEALVHAIKTGAYPNAPSGEAQTAFPRLWYMNWPNKAIAAALDLPEHEVETRTVTAAMKPGTRARIAAALGVPSVERGDKYVVPKRYPQPIPSEKLATLGPEIARALELIGAGPGPAAGKKRKHVDDPAE